VSAAGLIISSYGIKGLANYEIPDIINMVSLNDSSVRDVLIDRVKMINKGIFPGSLLSKYELDSNLSNYNHDNLKSIYEEYNNGYLKGLERKGIYIEGYNHLRLCYEKFLNDHLYI
jgi:hypothetical protein